MSKFNTNNIRMPDCETLTGTLLFCSQWIVKLWWHWFIAHVTGPLAVTQVSQSHRFISCMAHSCQSTASVHGKYHITAENWPCIRTVNIIIATHRWSSLRLCTSCIAPTLQNGYFYRTGTMQGNRYDHRAPKYDLSSRVNYIRYETRMLRADVIQVYKILRY